MKPADLVLHCFQKRVYTCRSRKFSQRGSNCDVFCLFVFVDERIQIPLLVGHYRPTNAIEMAFRWLTDDGQTLNAGSVALSFFKGSGPVLLKKPIFL